MSARIKQSGLTCVILDIYISFGIITIILNEETYGLTDQLLLIRFSSSAIVPNTIVESFHDFLRERQTLRVTYY